MFKTSLVIVAAILTCAFGADAGFAGDAAESPRWFKGNLHTHSHWSDGDDYLENIALWYQQHGYQFLVFTDHNVLADRERWVVVEKTKGGLTAYRRLKENFPEWLDERMNNGRLEVRLRKFSEVADRFNQPGEFLVIQGEEISDHHHGRPIHLNASNVQEMLYPRHGASVAETIQNNVDAVLAQRERSGQPVMVHLNHPNFGYVVTAEDLVRIQGEKFFEVYNGHPAVHNSGDEKHASTERMWDIVNAQRLGVLGLPVMYGLAVDDAHNYHDIPSRGSEPGRGWVMVRAGRLSAHSLIHKLEAGDFYSSSGVKLKDIRHEKTRITVEVDPVAEEVYQIDFIGTLRTANFKGTPFKNKKGEPLPTTHRYSDEIGQVLKTVKGTSATYEFTGEELYVRAVVTSSAAHPNPSERGEKQRAWVQPVVISPVKP